MLEYIIIALAVSLISALIFVVVQRMLFRNKENSIIIPADLSESLQSFDLEIEAVEKSVRLLEEFAGDYFLTLNESGFKVICDISEALTSTYTLSNSLAEAGQFNEAKAIVEYVHIRKGVGSLPAVLADNLSQSSVILNSWQEIFRSRINMIDRNISEASERFKTIGRVRSSSRRMTHTTLGDIRSILLQEPAKIANAK